MKKFLIFPGAFQFASNYRGFEGVDIWLRSNQGRSVPPADCYVGHSLGASFLLSSLSSKLASAQYDQNTKFIFIAPLVQKRNMFAWFYRWFRFYITEGIAREKIVPMSDWGHALKLVLSLLKVDVLAALERLPKENILIIRGKQDKFFFDEKSADTLRKGGFEVIEVEAGHMWNENVAEVIRRKDPTP